MNIRALLLAGLLAGLIVPPLAVSAQHEQHEMPTPPPAAARPEDHAGHDMPPADEAPVVEDETATPVMAHDHEMTMTTQPLGISASRAGSGTSWLPDSTPMYGLMGMAGDWELMYHGAAHLMYDVMNGPRGDEKLVLPNWAMVMARHNPSPRDEWRLGAMLSLDPLTVGGAGYPLLLQTGETWNDEPLRDHQHPHNFFTELSARYTRAIGADAAGYLYLAPVGEPALGPPAYMHRTFSLDNPLAPIGHHWQDATHIAYGVVTAGVQNRQWQLEASTFNGREPGENRFEIESPTFDSFSARVSHNPTRDLALQASYGFLESPEALHPGDAHRLAASTMYNRPLGTARNFQTTLVWGRNRSGGENFDSYLLEGQLKQDGGWTPFLRYEYIRKNAEELVLPETFDPEDRFNLQQVTLGIVRDLPSKGDYQWGIGAQGIISLLPEELTPVYGDNPTGWVIFLRVHPKRMPGHR
ncbi:MAG: hypothetical protein ACYDCO_21600 [Armatimonadota bacterium]